jgi:hypothetical protein
VSRNSGSEKRGEKKKRKKNRESRELEVVFQMFT